MTAYEAERNRAVLGFGGDEELELDEKGHQSLGLRDGIEGDIGRDGIIQVSQAVE